MSGKTVSYINFLKAISHGNLALSAVPLKRKLHSVIKLVCS